MLICRNLFRLTVNHKRLPMHHALDETDLRILDLLQQDARLTNKEIADKIGKSVTPVFERIKKLEREGYIQHYIAVLDSKKIDKGLSAFAHVQLKDHCNESMLKFEEDIVRFNEVMECYRMAGEYDYLVNIVVKDMDEYNNFVMRKLSTVYHLGIVQTYFVLDEMKKKTAFNLNIR
jgi:DNA-binding Lrp family transcriptional regulator